MTTTQIVATLDAEIARLRQVRGLLAEAERGSSRVNAKAPRALGAATKATASVGKRRTLSPEARERIAAAQRARWAAHTAAKTGSAAPKRGRGRPKKEVATGKRSDAGKQDGAEATA